MPEGFRADIYRGSPHLEWMARTGKQTPGYFAQRKREQEEQFNRPQLVRTGTSPEFSTCKSLQSWPAYCFDVNAYYAELGVHWQATNKQIKEAYLRMHGERSVRLTYIVQQLLDSGIRRLYDAVQLGSVFFDKYVAEYVRTQMNQDEFRNYGRIRGFEERIDEGDESLDLGDFINREFALDKTGRDEVTSYRWPYSYYQLRTSVTDPVKLRAWQILLLSIWPRSELLCVGLIDGDAPAELHYIGYRTVAFINVNTLPTQHLALYIYSKHMEHECPTL